jgi:hypothetical protein
MEKKDFTEPVIGFFETIAAADMEKIHSAIIGWIFSENSEIFNSDDKASIIKELLVDKIKSDPFSSFNFNPLKVDVEKDNIDILLTGDNWLIVIENKIKSTQHSNQLLKYEYLTAKDDKTGNELKDKGQFSDKLKSINKDKKEPFYILLSLIEEKSNDDNNKWITLTYSKLHEILEKRFNIHPTSENKIIFNSYLNTIKNLSDVLSAFRNKHQVYKFVFTKDTTDESDVPFYSYIKNLRLETILQKAFYLRLKTKISDFLELSGYNISCNVSETRGNALLDFNFNEINIKGIKFEGYEVKPILQFQGKAVKLGLGLINEEKMRTKISKEDLEILKRSYAQLLLNSNKFCSILKSNKQTSTEKVEEIGKKLSNPRLYNGFISYPLNETNDYWQFKQGYEEFVKEKIEEARIIFQELAS